MFSLYHLKCLFKLSASNGHFYWIEYLPCPTLSLSNVTPNVALHPKLLSCNLWGIEQGIVFARIQPRSSLFNVNFWLIFNYLKDRVTERERKTDMDARKCHPAVASLSSCPQQLWLGWAEGRSPDFIWLSSVWQGLTHFSYPVSCSEVGRKLDCKCHCWGLN